MSSKIDELRARFNDVFGAGENMAAEFENACDLADGAIALLREMQKYEGMGPVWCKSIPGLHKFREAYCDCGKVDYVRRVEELLKKVGSGE